MDVARTFVEFQVEPCGRSRQHVGVGLGCETGGQWQRLACSRALYRRPSLLILDEPTSQMDPRGEHQIFEQIKAIAADRITIVVTHRLENTKVADHIIVMEHGRITEQGRYDDLVHAGGTFAELLELSQDR
nr:ATP-binding cassette domain-containing protein [Streptomyces sp. QHH-9511]